MVGENKMEGISNRVENITIYRGIIGLSGKFLLIK